jgi:hypothetical protein
MRTCRRPTLPRIAMHIALSNQRMTGTSKRVLFLIGLYMRQDLEP